MDDKILERAELLDTAAGLLHRARTGVGGALVFEGPGGIGKSTLLDAVAGLANGLRVARASATLLERSFAFGVVRGLLGPFAPGGSGSRRGPAIAAQRVLEGSGAEPRSELPSQAALYGLFCCSQTSQCARRSCW